MLALCVIAFLSSVELFLKLSAYSLATFFLLAFATLGAALWSGP
jgi:hypothetical protein